MSELDARLDELEQAYRDLTDELADPERLAGEGRYGEVAARHAEVAEVLEVGTAWRAARDDAGAARELAAEADDDERDALLAEAEQAEALAADLGERLQLLLVPADPYDAKDVVVEVRAGAGGDEAGLFAAELVRMYERHAERLGWRVEPLSTSAQDGGGVKEAVFQVAGRGAFSRLKHESGVHRVQRVPVTESSGRIHTSTASVAVMPQAEDVDVELDPNDVRIDTFRSSGPGGQSVNTTDSAVRLTHEPTGIVVSCQDEKSQLQNREKAFRILRARLLADERERVARERAEERAAQIGTGDRSEKIRTYNFPQNRVTDHRIGLTVHGVQEVLDGDLDRLLDELAAEERRLRLAALAEQTVDDAAERTGA